MHKKFLRFLCLLLACASVFTYLPPAYAAGSSVPSKLSASGHRLKVLLIGNSFSVDSSEYLYDVATTAGYTITVGNLYKNSIALSDHWENAQQNAAVYTYRKTSTGSWSVSSSSMRRALQAEDWDVIFFHQYSTLSGVPESFYDSEGNNYVASLANYARRYCSNKSVKIGWEMTWALRSNSTNSDYKTYFDRDQLSMYQAICSTTQTAVAQSGSVDLIAQTGTAIQNARSSYLGDTLNRDDKHLSYDLGRYLAAMSIASACGVNLSSLDTLDTDKEDFSDKHLSLLKACVTDSEHLPYHVTSQQSSAPTLSKTKLTIDVSSKTRTLSWTKVEGATGYVVRRRKSTEDTWTRVKALSANKFSYTDSDVDNNTIYYYRVYALGDDFIANKCGNTVETCYATSVSLSASSTCAGKLTAKWSRNSKIDGYQLQYSTSSSFSNAKTAKISKNSTLSKTFSDLSKGKKYYVRIRTYKMTAGETYYSCWRTDSIKIKK